MSKFILTSFTMAISHEAIKQNIDEQSPVGERQKGTWDLCDYLGKNSQFN